jgi:hypothetical protein
MYSPLMGTSTPIVTSCLIAHRFCLQVKVREDKHRKELMLLSVDRGHEEYRAYRPVKRAQTAEGAAQPAASTSEADTQGLEV